MAKRLEHIRRMRDWWGAGLPALAIISLCILAAGTIAYGLLMVLAAVLGWNDRSTESWFYLSAVIWLPAAVGAAVTTDAFRDLLDRLDNEESQRRAQQSRARRA